VGAHVPAVRDESERAEQGAARNLDNHHCEGKRDDQPRAPLAFVMALAKEGVLRVKWSSESAWALSS
jgi:hypothetical protein